MLTPDELARRQEVEVFFNEYVQWMRNDIRREIDWVRPVAVPRPQRIVRILLRQKPRGAGNLLCALGLLVYTEALGRVWRWNFKQLDFYAAGGGERPGENFQVGFDRLDDGNYGRWRLEWEAAHPLTSVFEVLRSGMVHEYRPKISADMHLGFDQVRGVDFADNRLKVYVVPYHRHFCEIADEIQREVLALPTPSLPEPYLRKGPGAINTGRTGSTSGSSG